MTGAFARPLASSPAFALIAGDFGGGLSHPIHRSPGCVRKVSPPWTDCAHSRRTRQTNPPSHATSFAGAACGRMRTGFCPCPGHAHPGDPPPRIRMAQPDASLCTQTRQIKTMGMKIGERNRLSKWVAAQASSPSAACDAPLPAAHSWILRQPEPTEPRCSDVLRTVQADVGSWRKISAKSRPVQCSRGAVRVLRATRGRALGVVGHVADHALRYSYFLFPTSLLSSGVLFS